MTQISRRSLIAGALAAPVGMGTALAVARAADLKWDREADVVILGYGASGTCAAIEAHDAGSSVLILEKMAVGGGNVTVSAGGFVVPTDRNAYYTYLKTLYEVSNSEWDEAILNTFCDESVNLGKWLQSLAPEAQVACYGHAGYQTLPGSESVDKMSLRNVPGKKGGDRLYGVLRSACEKRGIPVLFKTPARRLIKSGGELIGVEAVQEDGKALNVRARKAVIICTGGFQCNPKLMSNYVFGTGMSFLGSPGHTGDGLLMAQSMGCALWHMNAVSAPLGIQVPGVQAGMAMVTRQPAFIWVDQDGRRFVNEKKLDYHCSWMAVHQYDAIRHRFPRVPCYMIMDETYIKAGPLMSAGASGYAINREGYAWSKDNSKEIASGVIVKADTIAELARKLGIEDPAVLEATVARWNKDLKTEGIDTEYGRTVTADPKMRAVFVGRDVKAWSAPIEQGPFYAVKLVPVMYHTMGGPKRSVKAEVLDPHGQPIPRLYVAGELGSTWGITYQGACANSDAIIFGRIAGREAAKLAPAA
ncbi:MAG: FAD-dependent oxidoreductase [Duodenibacillus sp.]|nr:FAD-dependent oxidoreductase [Duodenibacillus sp.]